MKLVTTSRVDSGGYRVVGQTEFLPTKIEAPKKLGIKMLVRIESVTAEILVIWTNLDRTYVALTNITLTAAIP